MDCYILVYVYRGSTEIVTAYRHNPKGLKMAKEDARKIIIESYSQQDTLGIYEQTQGTTGDDILKNEEAKRWLIDAGKKEQAEWYF